MWCFFFFKIMPIYWNMLCCSSGCGRDITVWYPSWFLILRVRMLMCWRKWQYLEYHLGSSQQQLQGVPSDVVLQLLKRKKTLLSRWSKFLPSWEWYRCFSLGIKDRFLIIRFSHIVDLTSKSDFSLLLY